MQQYIVCLKYGNKYAEKENHVRDILDGYDARCNHDFKAEREYFFKTLKTPTMELII